MDGEGIQELIKRIEIMEFKTNVILEQLTANGISIPDVTRCRNCETLMIKNAINLCHNCL